MTDSQHEQHLPTSILFAVLAAVSFTLMSLLGKFIGDRASTDTVLFARFAISLFILIPWIIKHPHATLKVAHPKKLIWRSCFSLLSFACFFYALRFISLSNAIVLNNTFPLFVPLAALVHSQVQTSRKVWMGIIVGFLGVLLVLQPDIHVFQPYALIALASGIFGAIAIVMIRHLTKTVSTLQILFYYFAFNTVATAIVLPFQWQTLPSDILMLLLGVGIFGALYQLFSTLCYAKSPVRLISPIMSVCIVSSGLIADFFIWREFPNLLGFAGIVLIVIGGTLSIYFGQKELASR
ncbi:MAG TPA: DMT family transporter [Rhabdochlamydiaceae bacterium]|nr:DMT family transporter [Rhabdochlamydiaceae bacterium]